MDITMNDLRTLLNHTRSIINSDKKTLERMGMEGRTEGVDGKITYYDYIKKRVNELEPIIANLENQFRNERIPIYFKKL